VAAAVAVATDDDDGGGFGFGFGSNSFQCAGGRRRVAIIRPSRSPISRTRSFGYLEALISDEPRM